MNRWKTESSLEEKIVNLPDKKPPVDLRNRIMRALPEYREPWFRRMFRQIGTGPVGYRTVGVMVSLVLAFYGGMQLDRFFPGSPAAVSGSMTATGNMNDEALFYLGRSLLAAGQSPEALNAFSRAELLRPENPRYSLWKGKAYRAMGALDKERQTYRQLVSKKPDLLPARLLLADNLLEDGQVLEAQQLYEQILADDPREKTALYRRAIALRAQGNLKDEAQAWKSYLEYYRTGASASEALRQLHDLGDYSFRKYQLGSKAVILNQECLLDPEGHNQQQEIERLVRHLQSQSLDKVSIVVFVENDAQQAEVIAKSLHKAVTWKTTGTGDTSVGLSWFDKAEPVDTADEDRISLSKGVLIFSAPQDNRNRRNKV